MNKEFALLNLLADGKFHSGESLGEALSLSRSGVWKCVNKLMRNYHVECHRVKGRGYKVPGGVELLDETGMQSFLSSDARDQLSNILILPTIPSTNAYVLDHLDKGLSKGFACFAEHQSAGKGRRGRPWFSPLGCNVFMSVLWKFSQDVSALQGLTLSVAVAVSKALREYGIEGVEVKWPNDIYFKGKKLAGILIEMQAVAHVNTWIVVGVGLNLKMPAASADLIDQPWVDVKSILGKNPARNHISGLLLNSVLETLPAFEREGFAPFADDWRTVDMLYGRTVNIMRGDEQLTGAARGIDAEGALRVEIDGEIQAFHSGEVSLRVGSQA